ncbi:hypothetical protein FRC03_008147 [Tulasnella sp. 419]|nr:hypothetical protein FRC03_008147 [Tulasnella sp. 419]
MSPSKVPSKGVCVYCASSPGVSPKYRDAAISLGKALGISGRPLVYGGGDKGLMGAVSAAVIDAGGTVTGIIPRAMVAAGGEGRGPAEKSTLYCELNEDTDRFQHIIVDNMHERKTEMAKRADSGFIALPGGFGTFEEVLESITWSQIGVHQKPVVLLNVLGFWEPLRGLIDGATKAGFIQEKYRGIVVFVDGPQDPNSEFDWGKAALAALDSWVPPADGGLFQWNQGEKTDKWALT